MAVVAPIANFGLIQRLVVDSDAAATVKNIAASDATFRVGIVGLLLVAALDVIVAWALYFFFERSHRSLSLLAALWRLVYAAMFAASSNELLAVSRALGSTGPWSALEPATRSALAMQHLAAFQSGWDMALVVFGLHLLVLGALAFESGYVPRYLGALLSVAGLGYLVDGVGKTLSPSYGLSVAAFTFIGEVVLIFWLLIKGWRVPEESQASARYVLPWG